VNFSISNNTILKNAYPYVRLWHERFTNRIGAQFCYIFHADRYFKIHGFNTTTVHFTFWNLYVYEWTFLLFPNGKFNDQTVSSL
jgi:hypothetical protein